MGQSHSIFHNSQKRKSFLITPKKLIRLRRQASRENPGAVIASPACNQHSETAQTPIEGEKCFYQETADGDRHKDIHEATTHTFKNVEATKHNDEVAAFSHDPTVRDESLIEENLLQQLRVLIENLLCGGDRIDGDIVIEIDSNEKTLKILPHSSLVSEDQEEFQTPQQLHHQGGNGVIIIREHTTPSSCDTFFADAVSTLSYQTSYENLTVTKLEQFEIASGDKSTLQINHSINVGSNASEFMREIEGREMPIVKNRSNNIQSLHGSDGNDKDKGIFNVSRVKKIELSEIPLATVASSSSSLVASTSVTSNDQLSTQRPSSNGGSNVLNRVISLTTANQNNDNNYLKQTKTSFIPEKLQFSAYEKFEGQMLLNWFVQSVPSTLSVILNESDLNALTMQYCTNLLIAGIIKPLDTPSTNYNEVFKSNVMYQWTHKEPTIISNLPGKLGASSWSNNSNASINVARKPADTSGGSSTSSPKRDGESKIPKLVSNFTSTPKPRLQSSFGSLYATENSILFNEFDQQQKSKISELKIKLSKCETVQETLVLIRSFLSEHAMQSSESSTNSGSLAALTNSLINGSDTTIFDKSLDSSLNTIVTSISQQKRSSPIHVPKTSRTPPKSRTMPSTPTSSSSFSTTKRLRKNNSADSVSSSVTNNHSNGILCRKCMLISTSPTKTAKRYVDKATVMDVEPIVFPKPVEIKSVEIQTDPILFDSDEKRTDDVELKKENQVETPIEKSEPMPPPAPPPPAPAPPPPPPFLSNSKPPGPPPPPLMNGNVPPPPPPGFAKGPCPLPPPIALSAGPGNKLSQSPSSNPSNLTMNGKPRPPAPLPLPASDFYQTNTLRKNAVNPPKPMKPLYWTRIVTPIIPQDSVDGSGEEDEKKISEKDELWKEIDETKLDNLDEFTELFSRQCVVPKAKDKTPLPKVKTIKVLDSKRSQNVGIFVRSIHVDFVEIEHAIYECDTSVVSQETLQNIMSIKATNDELAMIKEAVEAHSSNDSLIPLDTPEQFLLKLSQISSSAERISCIVFQDEFEEQCVMVSRKLIVVKGLCEFLLESEELKEVFSIILTLGNFMNGGNRQRGQADGFGLEILGKLKDVKSRDPKITLLHFIVKTFIARSRQNGVAITDLKLPVPDPNDVDKSLSIDFEECKQQLNTLKNKVEECKKTTERVIADSSEQHIQPFKDKMESFINMAAQRIESRFCKVEECKVLFIKTLKFYKYMPKTGPIEEATPAQFFEYWTSFTSDFNGIFKKELLILTNELYKKSRQVTKPQSKPASSSENTLKARINRLKNRDK